MENGADPLSAAISEANSLMESLGTEEVDFAIDSDDDDDAAAEDIHPLHDAFLTAAPEDPLTTAAASLPAMPEAPAGAAAATTPSPPVAQYIPQQPQQQPAATSASQQASMDFKASTSRFASNLANMAQRAATQVGMDVPTVNTASSFGSTPSFLSPANTPAFMGSQASLMQQQHQIPQQQQVAPPQPELDAEQKASLIQTHVGDLIPGEQVIMFLSGLSHVSDSASAGVHLHTAGTWCCAMTYYRILLFSTHRVSPPPKPADWNFACWPQHTVELLQMPLTSMEKVEKTVFHQNGGAACFGLIVHDKHNGRQLRFVSATPDTTSRAYDALQNYAFPGRRNLGYLFAFESKRETVMASVETDVATGQQRVTLPPCRKRFDAIPEFQRQFGGIMDEQSFPWSIWTTTNHNYQLSLNYPSILVGPATLDERLHPEASQIVRQCAAFRSEQRLPSMTWCRAAASIWRCSQPKVGLQGNRSPADELFLQHIGERAAAANAMGGSPPQPMPSRQLIQQLTGSTDVSQWTLSSAVTLKILDLRPRSAALANRTGGYGYENTSNYPGCSLQFCNIGNIHAVRDAYQKMSAVCMSPQQSDLQFSSAIEDSKWPSHIRLIWAASWETAYWVHVWKLPVVLHCSHGWDRTSQVGALAQLLLDPHYRTREVFSCLIEKDFLSFGHPFHTRCGHGEGKAVAASISTTASNSNNTVDEGQISPIFLQFLDCVFQLVNQYPEFFEFNTKYVLILSEHIYSCRFGNFLCDSERERELVAGIRQRTHSVWDYLDSRDDTRNARFTESGGVMLMPLPTLLRNVTLWTDRHAMHGPKPTTRWLPEGEAAVRVDLWKNDQASHRMTQQEQQEWMHAMPLAETEEGTPSPDKKEATPEEAKEGSESSLL